MVQLLMFTLAQRELHTGAYYCPSLFLFSICTTKQPHPTPSNSKTPHIPRPRPERAIVEMSSATFACILTGRDGVDARCLSDSLIHQLSPGRSQQEGRGGGGGGDEEEVKREVGVK